MTTDSQTPSDETGPIYRFNDTTATSSTINYGGSVCPGCGFWVSHLASAHWCPGRTTTTPAPAVVSPSPTLSEQLIRLTQLVDEQCDRIDYLEERLNHAIGLLERLVVKYAPNHDETH